MTKAPEKVWAYRYNNSAFWRATPSHDILKCRDTEVFEYVPAADLTAANAEIARLKEALRPFADAAAFYEQDPPHLVTAFDKQNDSDFLIGRSWVLTVGHLRAARAALNGSEG